MLHRAAPFLLSASISVLCLLYPAPPAAGQCVTQAEIDAGLPIDFDFLFAGLDRSLGAQFPPWLSRWNQENPSDPTPLFANEDNNQNGINDDDHLALLAAILQGEPKEAALAGISAANIDAIRAAYASNRAKVKPDLTLTILFVTVNIIDEVEKDDPEFGASLQDLVAAYMTIGDAQSVAFIRGLLITLGEIFIEQGVENGDIPGFISGTVINTLRSTVSSNFVASRYDCFGNAPGATRPNLLGATGNIGGSARTNALEYAEQGGDRQAWLQAKGVSLPPLQLVDALPEIVSIPAGQTTVFSSVPVGGDGAPVAYDWKKKSASGTLTRITTNSQLRFNYPLPPDSGEYSLFVCDGTWIRRSLPITLEVVPAPFEIVGQPEGGERSVGGSITFSVTAQGGKVAPSYQWFKGPDVASALPVSGATQRTLLRENLQPADAGVYFARVTGGQSGPNAVTLQSAAAALSVTEEDTEPPVITLLGPNPQILECPEPYTEFGATAIDNVDGDLTNSIAIGGAVIPGLPGSYVRTYTVADSAGNMAQKQRTVIVQDTVPPVLTLMGPNPLTLTCGADYVEPGFSALDACRGDRTEFVEASGSVDTSAPGSYVLTYSVSDPAGNVAETTRTVIVTDTAPPMLTLNGPAELTLECGEAYVEAGAAAFDDCAGDLTESIEITGSVNPGVPGTYTLTYRVSDPSGNTAEAVRTVTVTDTAPPVITLSGPNPLTLTCGAAFVDPGATAQDDCGGDLSAQIAASGTVDTSAAGTYTRTYTVSDASGNVAESTRTIIVTDTAPPSITLLGTNPLIVACGAAFVDPGATAQDACDGDLSEAITVSGTVDPGTPGDYTLTYRVTDAAGNSAERSRTVRVTNSAAPILSLNGDNPLTLACGGEFTDPGATAQDACEGDISARISVEGSVDADTPGVYTLTYAVSDTAGNGASATREVVVIESETAAIVLLGPNPLTIDCGTAFEDPGAILESACGATGGEIVTSGSVGAAPGTYTLTYRLEGANVEADPVERTVIVEDSAPPVLELLGALALTVGCGTEFVDPGATALDACDGDLSDAITRFGSVDTDTPGVYTLRYEVSDAAGNVAEITRTVTVAAAAGALPVITLLGPNPLTLNCGEIYNEPGAEAVDACGGGLNEEIAITGAVGSAPGSYVLTYRMEDAAGNVAAAERTVTVENNCEILIVEQPRDFSLYTGRDGDFRVRAEGGGGPLTYTWFKDGTPIEGAGEARLRFRDARPEDAGTYTCAVSDGAGSVLSAPATLSVFEPPADGHHSADTNRDWSISLSEALRVVQFYNSGGFGCDAETEDGYVPGGADQDCAPHDSDYNPRDWNITLGELLRLIQFFNTPAGLYRPAPGSEDGFAPGAGAVAAD